MLALPLASLATSAVLLLQGSSPALAFSSSVSDNDLFPLNDALFARGMDDLPALAIDSPNHSIIPAVGFAPPTVNNTSVLKARDSSCWSCPTQYSQHGGHVEVEKNERSYGFSCDYTYFYGIEYLFGAQVAFSCVYDDNSGSLSMNLALPGYSCWSLADWQCADSGKCSTTASVPNVFTPQQWYPGKTDHVSINPVWSAVDCSNIWMRGYLANGDGSVNRYCGGSGEWSQPDIESKASGTSWDCGVQQDQVGAGNYAYKVEFSRTSDGANPSSITQSFAVSNDVPVCFICPRQDGLTVVESKSGSRTTCAYSDSTACIYDTAGGEKDNVATNLVNPTQKNCYGALTIYSNCISTSACINSLSVTAPTSPYDYNSKDTSPFQITGTWNRQFCRDLTFNPYLATETGAVSKTCFATPVNGSPSGSSKGKTFSCEFTDASVLAGTYSNAISVSQNGGSPLTQNSASFQIQQPAIPVRVVTAADQAACVASIAFTSLQTSYSFDTCPDSAPFSTIWTHSASLCDQFTFQPVISNVASSTTSNCGNPVPIDSYSDVSAATIMSATASCPITTAATFALWIQVIAPSTVTISPAFAKSNQFVTKTGAACSYGLAQCKASISFAALKSTYPFSGCDAGAKTVPMTVTYNQAACKSVSIASSIYDTKAKTFVSCGDISVDGTSGPTTVTQTCTVSAESSYQLALVLKGSTYVLSTKFASTFYSCPYGVDACKASISFAPLQQTYSFSGCIAPSVPSTFTYDKTKCNTVSMSTAIHDVNSDTSVPCGDVPTDTTFGLSTVTQTCGIQTTSLFNIQIVMNGVTQLSSPAFTANVAGDCSNRNCASSVDFGSPVLEGPTDTCQPSLATTASYKTFICGSGAPSFHLLNVATNALIPCDGTPAISERSFFSDIFNHRSTQYPRCHAPGGGSYKLVAITSSGVRLAITGSYTFPADSTSGACASSATTPTAGGTGVPVCTTPGLGSCPSDTGSSPLKPVGCFAPTALTLTRARLRFRFFGGVDITYLGCASSCSRFSFAAFGRGRFGTLCLCMADSPINPSVSTSQCSSGLTRRQADDTANDDTIEVYELMVQENASNDVLDGSQAATRRRRLDRLQRERDLKQRRAANHLCPVTGQVACKVGRGFECIDVAVELESCGGCLEGVYQGDGTEQVGEDCTAMAGAVLSTVSCAARRCSAARCVRGFQLNPLTKRCELI